MICLLLLMCKANAVLSYDFVLACLLVLNVLCYSCVGDVMDDDDEIFVGGFGGFVNRNFQ